MSLSISGNQSIAHYPTTSTGPSPATALPLVTDSSNNWVTQYLTGDDYKLASASAGYDVKPDAANHLGLHPAILDQIALARRAGEITNGADVSAAFITSFHNTNAASDGRTLAYIAARDASLPPDSSTNAINYLA